MLEVNDAKTSSRDVEEEVAFANVGIRDGELIHAFPGRRESAYGREMVQ